MPIRTKLAKDIKKEAFIEAFRKTFGNVSQSCEIVGISRTAYYDWLNADPEFKKRLDTVQPEEIFVDFAEKALINRIEKGDTTAIIFSLKTKGKKRGYIEKQEVDHTTGGEKIESVIHVASLSPQELDDAITRYLSKNKS